MGAAQLAPIKGGLKVFENPCLLIAESFPDRVLRKVPLKSPDIFWLVRSQRGLKCCEGAMATSWECLPCWVQGDKITCKMSRVCFSCCTEGWCEWIQQEIPDAVLPVFQASVGTVWPLLPPTGSRALPWRRWWVQIRPPAPLRTSALAWSTMSVSTPSRMTRRVSPSRKPSHQVTKGWAAIAAWELCIAELLFVWWWRAWAPHLVSRSGIATFQCVTELLMPVYFSARAAHVVGHRLVANTWICSVITLSWAAAGI